MEELFPLVDNQGNIIGSATRKKCHSGTMWLHPVVHLHLVNKDGDLFLQKRGLHKDIQPGKWDTSVGGHVDYGETIAEALIREAREELNIEVVNPNFLGMYVFQSTIEQELVYSYIYTTDTIPRIRPEELDEGQYWSVEKIESLLNDATLTENFKKEYSLFEKEIKQFIANITNDTPHNKG